MTIRNRAAFVLSGIMLLAGVVGCAYPECVYEWTRDFWEGDSDQESMLESQARGSSLEERIESSKKRRYLKHEITLDLIEDRITLEQATEQVMMLNHSGEDLTEAVRDYFRAESLVESTRL